MNELYAIRCVASGMWFCGYDEEKRPLFHAVKCAFIEEKDMWAEFLEMLDFENVTEIELVKMTVQVQ